MKDCEPTCAQARRPQHTHTQDPSVHVLPMREPHPDHSPRAPDPTQPDPPRPTLTLTLILILILTPPLTEAHTNAGLTPGGWKCWWTRPSC